LLTWLWLVGVTNLFNFLDGIDGYAGWQAVVGCAGAAGMGLGPAMSAAAAAAGGAAAGFLWQNWHPARIFLGDVGSTALGFFLAACPLAAPPERRAEAVFAMAMLLWFFLSDGAYTLVKRLARGERIWTPHRNHLYQQLARRLGRHDAVVKRVGAAGTLLGAAAVGAYHLRDPRLEWAVMAVAAAAFAVYRHTVESSQALAAAGGRQAG
jgi:UDP-N-acetylmuramyl pentapeptide phosphotransferase/UDP-N-acetylglucosamine-1-phosphate transferase